MPEKIFICYRRMDSNWPANALFSKLTGYYGHDSVFKDDAIFGGEEFPDRLKREVDACSIFLLIIGPHWVEEMKKRAANKTDYVRTELELAISMQKHIIPVLIDDTEMPSEADIPESLNKFPNRNKTVLTFSDTDKNIQELIFLINHRIRETSAAKKVLVLDESYMKMGIQLGILARLEEQILQFSKKYQCLADAFDLVLATGSNSFIATEIALGTSIRTIRSALPVFYDKLFKEKSMWERRFFGPVFSKQKLIDFLNTRYSKILTGDSAFKTKFCLFSFNMTERQLCSFSNLIPEYNDLPIRSVIEAAMSAPTYYSPAEILIAKNKNIFIDGSLGTSSNPTMSAANFIYSQNQYLGWKMEKDKLLLVSVGTGRGSRKKAVKTRDMNIIYWARTIPEIIDHSFINSNEVLIKKISKILNSPAIPGDKLALLENRIAENEKLFSLLRYNLDLADSFPENEFYETTSGKADRHVDWAFSNAGDIISNNQLERWFNEADPT